jgi:hypothetical protein
MICGDQFAARQTLRQRYADAKLVLRGELRNPKANADGVGGTTEFHVTQTLKGDAAPRMLLIPRYLPVIGQTPPDYFFFCTMTDGKVDPLHGLPATATLASYLSDAAKLDAKDARTAMAFFFKHLESSDETIALDAFLEIAKASDRDLIAAAAGFDRAKLRSWISDEKVPGERLGVYALLLGLCGTADDAAWLSKQLAAAPLPERYSGNLGGLLAGLAILDPQRGWPLIHATLATKDGPVTHKLSVIGTLRYFQATRPKESREQVLKGLQSLLDQPDLADVAIDDLRRWAWWDLTNAVLKCFDKQGYASPLMRRGIVRYALSCPNAEAKTFVEKVRASDPKLIAKVEESLKLSK